MDCSFYDFLFENILVFYLIVLPAWPTATMISTPCSFNLEASSLTASTASLNVMSGPGLLKKAVSGVMYPIIPDVTHIRGGGLKHVDNLRVLKTLSLKTLSLRRRLWKQNQGYNILEYNNM